LYWYFQQNQCLNIKKHIVHNRHRLAWSPSDNCPVCPCAKTAPISGDVDNDSQSNCHSDSDSCTPEVMVSDASVLSAIKNEQK